jgi:rhamnosyltransferase subunit B
MSEILNGKRIVISTFGSFGDLHPYIALALELKRRGARVVVATTAVYRPKIEALGLEFHNVRPETPLPKSDEAIEMMRRGMDTRDGTKYVFKELLMPHIRASYEDVLEVTKSADMLISHTIPFVAPLIAAKTNVRWVSCILAPGAFFSVYDPPVTPAIPSIVQAMIRQPLLARPFLSLVKRQVAQWTQPIETLRRDLNLSPSKANPIFEGQHSPALVLALYSKLLGAPQRDYPPNTHITGFAFFDAHDPSVYADMMNDGNSGAQPANGTARGETLSPELEEFLAAGEPPIVFTLGSAAVWVADDFFRESIKAAQELNRRAVLLVADARNMPQMNLPANTKAFDYAPYSELFPRASVLVHQGGIGTTGQALRSGRPMLIVPFSHDQPDNAARCVRLGVARTMKRREYKAARIARELDALLADQTYAQRAAETRRFVQNENGTKAACDLIEKEFGNRQSDERFLLTADH